MQLPKAVSLLLYILSFFPHTSAAFKDIPKIPSGQDLLPLTYLKPTTTQNPTPPPQGARALPLFSFKIEFLCNILCEGVSLEEEFASTQTRNSSLLKTGHIRHNKANERCARLPQRKTTKLYWEKVNKGLKKWRKILCSGRCHFEKCEFSLNWL